MPNVETYNGWSNRQTELVHDWIRDDPYYAGMALDVVESLAEVRDQFDSGIAYYAACRFLLADLLRDDFRLGISEEIGGLWSDLLQCSFQRINWTELADSLLVDYLDQLTA
jgi:hypothetical protein